MNEEISEIPISYTYILYCIWISYPFIQGNTASLLLFCTNKGLLTLTTLAPSLKIKYMPFSPFE